MSSFTAPLIVEVDQGERNGRGTATLIQPFRYEVRHLGSGDLIEVPSGFQTDFCSVPGWARWAISNFDRSAKAAVVHDFLWQSVRTRSRAEIDLIYREALAVLQVGFLRRWILWAGVRCQAFITRDR